MMLFSAMAKHTVKPEVHLGTTSVHSAYSLELLFSLDSSFKKLSSKIDMRHLGALFVLDAI